MTHPAAAKGAHSPRADTRAAKRAARLSAKIALSHELVLPVRVVIYIRPDQYEWVVEEAGRRNGGSITGRNSKLSEVAREGIDLAIQFQLQAEFLKRKVGSARPGTLARKPRSSSLGELNPDVPPPPPPPPPPEPKVIRLARESAAISQAGAAPDPQSCDTAGQSE